MILQPFSVNSKSKNYDFVDRDALDSEATKSLVNKKHAEALAFVQKNALCENRGLPNRGAFDNRILAVFEGGALVGIWMLGCIVYISGPWEDTSTWNVTNPGASVVLEAVPMSGVLSMTEDDEAEFAADVGAFFVKKANPALVSGQGLKVGFDRLHYGIFKADTDPASKRAQSHHAKMRAHPDTEVIESPDPNVWGLTLVEIRAKDREP